MKKETRRAHAADSYSGRLSQAEIELQAASKVAEFLIDASPSDTRRVVAWRHIQNAIEQVRLAHTLIIETADAQKTAC